MDSAFPTASSFVLTAERSWSTIPTRAGSTSFRSLRLARSPVGEYSLSSDAKAGPDGMTFDQDGRLYVADYGTGFVAVLDSGGRLLRRFSTGLRHPSNVAFGGRDLGELYVTGAPGDESGAGQLVVLSLGVRGRSSRATPVSLAKR